MPAVERGGADDLTHRTAFAEAWYQLPLSFEAHQSRDDGIDFLARGAGYTLAIAPAEVAFAFAPKTDAPDRTADTVLRMRLAGASSGASSEAIDRLPGTVNYFTGNDPTRWRTDIPTFRRVRYQQVYRGIDVVYYGNQKRLEYDFIIAPGGDTRAIRLQFDGADQVEIDGGGDLLLSIGDNTVRQPRPSIYQEVGGERRSVEGRYAMNDDGSVGFSLGEYDARASLVIDPVLVYSTYLGGSSSDVARAIAVDSSGNAYIAGYTDSDNFPSANAIQVGRNGTRDVFVTKINAAGTALVYSSYLGGGGTEEARGIAVDSAGNVYVTGFTASDNFPTVNPIQAARGADGQDAFVAKINAAGNALVYSTYLGGSKSSEFGEAVAVDASGNAYLTGTTFSDNFPVVSSIQSSFGGGSTDVYVSKINAAGSAFVYSTYLGGNGTGTETGKGIALDSSRNAYVTGETSSTNFPTANAVQSGPGGGTSDAFVTKINAAGSALIFSTYLGGGNQDGSESIAVDSGGSAYVAGSTQSTNFPTANAIQPANGGTSVTQDAFVTKLNAAGSAFVYSTYLGGAGGELATGIKVDASGSAYVAGSTGSVNTFPVLNAIQCSRSGSQDVFVTKINAAGTALVYSTYLGGGGSDSGEGLALDSSSNVYLTGYTTSTDYPVATPIQANSGGGTPFGDGFVTKLNDALSAGACATPTPTPTPTPASRLLNISTRLNVGTGDNALIGGFIVTGSEPKKVIIRALGPSLDQTVSGSLEDPTLELFDTNGALAFNDNWKQDQQAEIEGTGIPPTRDAEAAIVRILPAGGYTAVVRGKSDVILVEDKALGIGVVEVYDLAQTANSTLANISSRGVVGTGDNALIGGFITGGPAGGTDVRAVVRALGPSLEEQGVFGALRDPTLELIDANGTTVRSNDNWRDSQEAELTAIGIQPTIDAESALVTTLPAGGYTAIVRGKDNSTGVGVVEIYNVQ